MKREYIALPHPRTRLDRVCEGQQIEILGKTLFLAYHRAYYTFFWPTEASYRRACAINREDPPGWVMKAAGWSHFIHLPPRADDGATYVD